MSIISTTEGIKQLYYSGDPEIRSWFLVRNDILPIVLCLMYTFVVKWIGPAFMKNRKPYSLRVPMILYNLLLVLIYIICVSRAVYLMLRMDSTFICTRFQVKKGDSVYELAIYGYIIYLLKYVEFCDTFFFILRKKEKLITNLHVVHHSILPIAVWTLCRTENSTFQFLPGIINSIVHVVMYSYYALAAMGPEVRKYLWWKRYLTLMQIGQFVAIVALQVAVKPLLGCPSGKMSSYILCAICALFFVMFSNFYLRTFVKKLSYYDEKLE